MTVGKPTTLAVLALLMQAVWTSASAQAPAPDGWAMAPSAFAPITEALEYWSHDGAWGRHHGLAPLPLAGPAPRLAFPQPSELLAYLDAPAASPAPDITFARRHYIFEPPARLSVPIPPEAYRPLVTVEASSLVRSAYGKQFLKGWTFITSVELSILAVTMAMPKDWTGWHDDFIQDGLNNLQRAWTSPPIMDDDHWFHNYVGHPYGGNVYYNTVRSQGATPVQSFFFSAFMSGMWEYVFEAMAEQPSIQDLIITPTTGAVLGELVHRLTLTLKKDGTNLGEKALILVMNPTHAVMAGF
ncbi:MAG: DUF3943 domain-containing protein [Gemmatimonadales bacterium]|nr:DUF3943 domain-containing protein [Gemmatimonadales bacterium]